MFFGYFFVEVVEDGVFFFVLIFLYVVFVELYCGFVVLGVEFECCFEVGVCGFVVILLYGDIIVGV